MNTNKENNENELNYCFLARIVIEAKTPLSIKSGEKSITTDAVVITDVNGLPYIPGSSIAGVIRHAWKEMHETDDSEKSLFGFQKGKNGFGSRVIISEARILNSKGEVMDGLLSSEEICKDELLQHYMKLPIRQHVRINHRGTAMDNGKYDEQVVFTGTRFCFELEMLGGKEEESTFKEILKLLYHSTFRLGSGTRRGFGEIEVSNIQYESLPKNDKKYLEKSSNLEKCKNWYKEEFKEKIEEEFKNEYSYELQPVDFFLFGSGFADEDADMTPVTEMKVSWEGDAAKIKEHLYLLPASSVKGAIAHRVAYHYNRITKIFADGFTDNGKNKEGKTINDYVGANNIAVRLLFGYEGDTTTRKIRGNVIFSDLYDDKQEGKDKILNHVAIDRFTGGAINGALFSEKTVYGKAISSFKLEIFINKKEIEKLASELYGKTENVYKNTIDALEAALKDLCNGLLPLGGGVNRGNGIFHGKKIEPKQEEVQ